MTTRLATYNVENLFARAKALNTTTFKHGEPALKAFGEFNRIAAKAEYGVDDKQAMLAALETLRVLVRKGRQLRLNPRPFDDAWALLRENHGNFLVAPANKTARIDANGRDDWIGWAELATEPVDEIATRMTARVINEVGADILCVVEAEDRPSLVRFDAELLGRQYAHRMLVDGNDPRGIDVGLLCAAPIDVLWVRSNVDVPDPKFADGRSLFSRDCPIYHLRLPGGAELFLLLNHLKSQSFSSGNPDPLRTRQSEAVRKVYDALRNQGARFVAILGDFNKGPDRNDPAKHPTLEALFDPASGLVDAYGLSTFTGLFGDKDTKRERPGTFQSCTMSNRLDYILLSPELAEKVTGGGVFRKGLWGSPGNLKPAKQWTTYREITESKHAASDHAAVFVDLDL